MNIRFRILTPTPGSAPDFDLNGQPLLPVSETGMSLKLIIDGTTIIDSVDVSSETLPITGSTTTNNYAYTLSRENTDWFKVNIAFLGKSVDQSTDLSISIAQAGYLSYAKSYAIYGYDLGNNVNQSYNDSNPILDNPDFDMILIPEANNVVNGIQTKVYASFVAYRKPFTDLIYVYKNNSGQGLNDYINEGDSSILLMGADGLVQVGIETVIHATHTEPATGTTSDSDSITLGVKVWHPDFTTDVASTYRGNNDSECINAYEDHVASTRIDISSLSQFPMDDVIEYSFNDLQLLYQLYDNTGTLVSDTVINAQLDPYPYAVSPADYFDWKNLLASATGDFLIIVALRSIGIKTGVLYSSGALVVNTFYRITNNSGGADFTGGGAANNTVGTEFAYNGGVITWGTGILEELTTIKVCTKQIKVCGVFWYTINQTDCSAFKVFNNGFFDGILKVSELDENGSFNEISSQAISLLNNLTISLTNDGIFKFEISRDVDIDDVITPQSYFYIVHNYCALRTCMLDKITNLVCGCADTRCKCKENYDFMSLITTAHTYFNLLNDQYSYNYFYTALSTNQLADIRTAKEFLDRTTEYCAKCTKGCDNETGNC